MTEITMAGQRIHKNGTLLSINKISWDLNFSHLVFLTPPNLYSGFILHFE